MLALIGCVSLALSLRRLRAAQRVVLGEGELDLISHSATLAEAFDQLRDYVHENARLLDQRLGQVEEVEAHVSRLAVMRPGGNPREPTLAPDRRLNYLEAMVSTTRAPSTG